MEEKVSVLIVMNERFHEELRNSLEENKEYIKEIVFSGKEEDVSEEFKSLSIPVKFLDVQTDNKAILKNRLVESASSEYLLFLNSGCSMEDSTIEELLEDMEASDADIVYPNLVLQFMEDEKVKNFSDFYGKEMEILKSLSIENFIPEWGILVKKAVVSSLNYFDEELADYEFYEFLYRNLKKIRLKLSEFSFVVQAVRETFIDTSYRSYVLRNKVLNKYDWKTEIFSLLSWDESPDIAEATVLTIIGDRLASYYDYFNAADYYRKALLMFHNQETLRKLVKTYMEMGLFGEAKNLLTDSQGMSAEEQEEFNFYIDKISLLVEELETAIENGKIVEAINAIQDVALLYEGAPIHNVLGVIKWIQEEKEEAFKFFYKAVTMNPLNKDYLFNLAEVSKVLKKEDYVEGLIKRLVSR